MEQLGLGVNLYFKSNQAVKNMRNVSQAARQVFGNFAALRQASRMLGYGAIQLNLALAPLEALFIRLARGVMEYQRTLSALAAALSLESTNLSRDVNNLSTMSFNVGGNIRFVDNEVAELLNVVARAGYAGEDLRKLTEAGLTLGALEDISPASAVEDLISVLNQFSIPVSEANRVISQMSVVNARTASSMEDLRVALRYASAAFDALGSPIDDALLGIGLLAQTGIKGSTAGTSLSQALVEILNNSDDAREALAELGLTQSSFKNSEGNFIGTQNMLEMLFNSLQGVEGNFEKARLLNEIFGKRGLRAIQPLIEAYGNNREYTEQLAAGIHGATNEAERMAAIRLDNFIDQIKMVWSYINMIAIRVYSGWLEYFGNKVKVVKDFLGEVVTYINAIQANGWWDDLRDTKDFVFDDMNEYVQQIVLGVSDVRNIFQEWGEKIDYVIWRIKESVAWLREGGEFLGSDWVRGLTKFLLLMMPIALILGGFGATLGIVGFLISGIASIAGGLLFALGGVLLVLAGIGLAILGNKKEGENWTDTMIRMWHDLQENVGIFWEWLKAKWNEFTNNSFIQFTISRIQSFVNSFRFMLDNVIALFSQILSNLGLMDDQLGTSEHHFDALLIWFNMAISFWQGIFEIIIKVIQGLTIFVRMVNYGKDVLVYAFTYAFRAIESLAMSVFNSIFNFFLDKIDLLLEGMMAVSRALQIDSLTNLLGRASTSLPANRGVPQISAPEFKGQMDWSLPDRVDVWKGREVGQPPPEVVVNNNVQNNLNMDSKPVGRALDKNHDRQNSRRGRSTHNNTRLTPWQRRFIIENDLRFSND